MTTAVCLYGKYSQWYKKNNFNVKGTDIYAFPITPEDIPACNSDPDIKSTTCISGVNITECPQIQYHSMVSAMINTYVMKKMTENFPKYDKYLIIPFNAVIILNFALKNDVVRYEDIVTNCIEIISNKFVRNVQKCNPVNMYNIVQDRLQMLLDRLFSGKVLLPAYVSRLTEKIPKDSALYCIQSVIKTTTVPLVECSHRTVYSHEERFNQTLTQVSTLNAFLGKETTPSSILLLEGSCIGFNELEALSKHCYIVLYSYDRIPYEYANINYNKSIYEMYVLKDILSKIPCKWLVKFGGRYTILSDLFNPKSFLLDRPVFNELKDELTYSGKPTFEIILYSIPKSYKDLYIDIYQKSLDLMLEPVIDETKNYSAEFCMYNFTKEKNIDYIHIPRLYITGNDAIFGFSKIL